MLSITRAKILSNFRFKYISFYIEMEVKTTLQQLTPQNNSKLYNN